MEAFQFNSESRFLSYRKCLTKHSNQPECVKDNTSQKKSRECLQLNRKIRGLQLLNKHLKNKNRRLRQMLYKPAKLVSKDENIPFHTQESDEKKQQLVLVDTLPIIKKPVKNLLAIELEPFIYTKYVDQNQNNKAEPLVSDYSLTNEIEEHAICIHSDDSQLQLETPITLNDQVACIETKHDQINKINETKSDFIILKDVEMPDINYQTDKSSSSKIKSKKKENLKNNQVNNTVPPLRAIVSQFLSKQNKDLLDLKKKEYLYEIQKYSEFYFLESLLLEMKNHESNMQNKGFFKSKSKIRKNFINKISQKIRDYIPTFCL
ncbi:uncharacterized protein LOC136084282 isoform X2 [Hydra vulgaris]|uniref:Uncharacterized protein LOC136084282 isoform X2 n=1 Tax=Hydra vulgaris TaxID=6087 RepID=A0ABM4CFF4_HYDVU